MGLLYVNGERYHDDETEMIEQLSRRSRKRHYVSEVEDETAERRVDMFDDGKGGSLAAQVRAAARARRDDVPST